MSTKRNLQRFPPALKRGWDHQENADQVKKQRRTQEGAIAEEETRQESTMEDSALGERHSRTPRSIAPWKGVDGRPAPGPRSAS